MPQITLRFVTTADWVSSIIRKETDCAFSHVEFVLDDEWTAAVRSPLLAAPTMTLGAHIDGGVRIRPVHYDNFTATEFATIECTAEQKQAVMASAAQCIGNPYDVTDIAGILFHQNWAVAGHWICSVFVAEKLINAGIPLLRVAPQIAPSITPRDVYLSPLLQTKEQS